MSMKMQLARAISDTVRKIDDQKMKLSSFIKELDDAAMAVTQVLGSDDEDGKTMLNNITQTKEQVQATIARLETAKDKLGQVGLVGRR